MFGKRAEEGERGHKQPCREGARGKKDEKTSAYAKKAGGREEDALPRNHFIGGPERADAPEGRPGGRRVRARV